MQVCPPTTININTNHKINSNTINQINKKIYHIHIINHHTITKITPIHPSINIGNLKLAFLIDRIINIQYNPKSNLINKKPNSMPLIPDNIQEIFNPSTK